MNTSVVNISGNARLIGTAISVGNDGRSPGGVNFVSFGELKFDADDKYSKDINNVRVFDAFRCQVCGDIVELTEAKDANVHTMVCEACDVQLVQKHKRHHGPKCTECTASRNASKKRVI